MEGEIQTIFNSKLEYNSNSEEFYKDYWQKTANTTQDSANLKYLIILKNLFPKGIKNKKILEVGVGGKGGIIINLKDENRVFGIDVSDSAILYAGELGLKIEKVNLDIEKLPYEDNYFDIVFAFEVFEHFANPQHAIEELSRVIVDNGNLIISAPNPLTYHWPRLFYPQLFEKKAFGEFLMINGFDVTIYNDFIYGNTYNGLDKLNIEEKAWSFYYSACKISLDDSEMFYKLGIYFWTQTNEKGLRIKPIEAIDLFRKSYSINKNEKARLMLFQSLIYRYVYDDTEEFTILFNDLINELKKGKSNYKEILFALIMAEIEICKHGSRLFNQEELQCYVDSLWEASNPNDKYMPAIRESYSQLSRLLS